MITKLLSISTQIAGANLISGMRWNILISRRNMAQNQRNTSDKFV
jgi:hypothetical protein